jgi:hypothetical protein
MSIQTKTPFAVTLTPDQIGYIILALHHSNRSGDCADTELQTELIAELGGYLAIYILNK